MDEISRGLKPAIDESIDEVRLPWMTENVVVMAALAKIVLGEDALLSAAAFAHANDIVCDAIQEKCATFEEAMQNPNLRELIEQRSLLMSGLRRQSWLNSQVIV